jgi:hypothetical protein
MNKQLAVVDVDSVLSEYRIDKIENIDSFLGAVKLARGVAMLRQSLEPHVKSLRQIEGSKLGYLVDDGNYSDTVVCNALSEGMIRGAKPVMNEINIIAGGCYLTKEFFFRRLSEFDGLTNLSVDIGLPHVMREPGWAKSEDGKKNFPVQGSAVVAISVSWVLGGVPGRMDCTKTDTQDTRIPIRLHNKYSIDQVIGLAESKILRRVYKRITRSSWVKEDDVPTVQLSGEIEGEVVEQLKLSEPGDVEKPKPEVVSDIEAFCGSIVRKFARCKTQQELNVAMNMLLEANTKDAERTKWIGTLAGDREMQIDEDSLARAE